MPDFDEDEQDTEEGFDSADDAPIERVVRGTPYEAITADSHGVVYDRIPVTDYEERLPYVVDSAWVNLDIGFRLVLESGEGATSVLRVV